ncbi:receptor-mediated endocytosis protein 6 homolog isoform X1 [Trichogramma pretiosum]|uniref:receptor-mediated endocytosis protein 6 homolog isoform X1 n=1 Tax=Trichogramma pretiosum TaxID=7493 RepID=UPI0006C99B63|nr:receptor-mediated endocytosis protein 6 homolog isoform X1 [Trichogramma pretiosum]XP_023313573.1 receptor-mediated endocytosis protein 6 homolog isoform X1 [Trichogramma pretiosum]
MSSVNSVESLGTLQWDMIELSGHLRQERLFVNSEQQTLQQLNEKVLSLSSSLAQQAWITAQQRVNLNRLILSKPDCTPQSCCKRSNVLENSQFLNANKLLRYQSCIAYGEFLCLLRTSPKLVASCLVEGDKVVPEMIENVIQSIASGLYGSCLLPEDKILVLKLLRHMILLQVVPSDNPRRVLRHGTSAFSRFYSIFHESLFSAKLFLTAALNGPIIQLLMEDEVFLDIDPDKNPIRFSPSEKLKKFGKEGTPDYQTKVQRHRQWIVNSLVQITQKFIVSIRENMHCFPTCICWLVRQMAGLLSKTGNVDPKEIHAMCTDLVFTYFICPAIVNPEPYGITDAPISYIARFNLMQVGQILQMLCLMKYQTVDSKVNDLYRRFEKDSVSSILDSMLDGAVDELDEEPTTIEASKLQGLGRSAALFTEAELNNLVTFLQSVNSVATSRDEGASGDAPIVANRIFDQKQLAEMLSQLPTSVNSATIVNNVSSSNASPCDTPVKRSSSAGLLGKVGRGRGARISGKHSISDNGEDANGTSGPEDDGSDKAPLTVLIIPFDSSIGESVGSLSEQKVLCMQGNMVDNESIAINLPEGLANGHGQGRESNVDRIETQEKRTRFSLSHDEVLFEGSIGNTSDNLEAVSEAASNHSVASSLELENEDQNDNLSDMVSANVSGRGTPNISGRDTPSSQLTEGDEGGRVGGENRQHGMQPQNIPTKQSRSDVDDKFCKFEIKKLMEGDETISLVSDTWSTDVLASDSEFIEQQERFPFLPQQEQPRPPPPLVPEPLQANLDVSETASEAWSTDVLASDSERMTEVDTDDTASVARSDDTARSEIESRGEPEGGEDTPPPMQMMDNSGQFFRPIREEALNRSTVPSSPTTPLSPSSSNVTGRGGTRLDYRRSTSDYVDSNSSSVRIAAINNSSKPTTPANNEDHLVQLMDKLQTDDSKSSTSDNVEVATSSGVAMANHIGAAAVAPALLLANHINPPTPSEGPKLSNGDIKSGLGELMNGNGDVVVRLSTASLTSSSSSGSEPRAAKTTCAISIPSSCNSSNKSVSMPTSSTLGADVPDGVASASGSAVQSPKPSTGAIPKSISFDMTAERGDKEMLDDDQKSKRGGFFGKLMSLRNRRGKSLRGPDEMTRCYDRGMSDMTSDGVCGGSGDARLRLRRIVSEDTTSTCSANSDTTDDILAKYRRKPSANSDTTSIESTQSRTKEIEDERVLIDPNNVEMSFAFADAKRKLRMVLSTADLQHVPWTNMNERNSWTQKENELVAFLQLQLAEAINLQDRALIAHLHETLRCVRLFNEDGCRKLFKSLGDDYQKRSPYIAYLIRSRQGLLSTLAHLDRLGERVKCDGDAVNSHLVLVCVKVFLDKWDKILQTFFDQFKKLTVSDEKQDLVDGFLNNLYTEMENDLIWQVANDRQLELARTMVERTLMAMVYQNAMYPNGDGDIHRDSVFHEHIRKLAKIVTPNHQALRIPKIYLYECPWPWAQVELSVISAYKTPHDKLQCVVRCATTIMNLLSMASERGIPAADDLIPVLVYVIIKTNPPSLLSTIQYVNSFYGNRLKGEEGYWWTQFCSAVEFIKTID